MNVLYIKVKNIKNEKSKNDIEKNKSGKTDKLFKIKEFFMQKTSLLILMKFYPLIMTQILKLEFSVMILLHPLSPFLQFIKSRLI